MKIDNKKKVQIKHNELDNKENLINKENGINEDKEIKKNSSLKTLYDNRKREKIEHVLKKKKLDSLKQKLNEYSKEKLMEKYREIKKKERMERENTKKEVMSKLELESIKTLQNIQEEFDDNIFFDKNIVNEYDTINKSNGNNIVEENSKKKTFSEIKNDLKEENENENENIINDYEDVKVNEDGNEEENENEKNDDDDDNDDENYDDEDEDEDDENESILMTESLSESESLETFSKEENDYPINENNSEMVNSNNLFLNTSPSQINSNIYKKNSSIDIKKSQLIRSRILPKNEVNAYIKADTVLTKVYVHFCKRANISINDIYSQFITDNLTKSQINEYLNPTKKSYYNLNYRRRMNNLYSYNSVNPNNNDIVVNKGTSGFKRRFGNKDKKMNNQIDRTKKLKTLQDIRINFINFLLSYGDTLQLLKQHQKENKELARKKKSIEVTMNIKIKQLIDEINYLCNDINDYQSHKVLRQEKLETQYNNFSKKIEKYMIGKLLYY